VEKYKKAMGVMGAWGSMKDYPMVDRHKMKEIYC
jgi:hypothetical protein